MSNRKTTQLRKLISQDVVAGDLVPIVDSTAVDISTTGETCGTYVGNLARLIISGAFVESCSNDFGFIKSNGLAFDQSITPNENINLYCYTPIEQSGAKFTLTTRVFFPSTIVTQSAARAIFGFGNSPTNIVTAGQRAYIGVENQNLIGLTYDGTTTKKIILGNFFTEFKNKTVDLVLSRDAHGTLNFFLNSACVGTLSGSASQISGSYIVMGNGTPNYSNIECTIYNAHLYNDAVTGSMVTSMYYGGESNSDLHLVSSYTSENLGAGPTQWLDSKGNNHILLPISGARASSPRKRFKLIFNNDGVSGFLGNGTQRDVLPENYVLTDAFAYSAGYPTLSIGSTSGSALYGEDKIYSCNNNRVELTNAIYNRNILQLTEFGLAHTDRSIYVFYSASAAPSTFIFNGYIAEYGNVLYTP